LHHALLHALRPFLMRSAEAILPNVDLQGWQRGKCPLCGGDPDFAIWNAPGDRHLLCGRCAGQWAYPDQHCVFCGIVDAAQLQTFAGTPRFYRLQGCDACDRYAKGFDGRNAARTIMLTYDAVATLPLDAALIQRGYIG